MRLRCLPSEHQYSCLWVAQALKQTASVTPDLEQVVGDPLLMGEWAASMALCQPRPTVVVNVLMAALGTAKQSAREGKVVA